jgi:hypothetical protein
MIQQAIQSPNSAKRGIRMPSFAQQAILSLRPVLPTGQTTAASTPAKPLSTTLGSERNLSMTSRRGILMGPRRDMSITYVMIIYGMTTLP